MSLFRMKTTCWEHHREHYDNEECPVCFRENQLRAIKDIADQERLSREESTRQFAANEELSAREREEDLERRQAAREMDAELRQAEREEDEARWEQEREDAEERAEQDRYHAANPGDYECPSCLFQTLKRNAKRCPKCHDDVPAKYWTDLAEHERLAREKALREYNERIERERPERHAQALALLKQRAKDAGYRSEPNPHAGLVVGVRINDNTNVLTATELGLIAEAYNEGIAKREAEKNEAERTRRMREQEEAASERKVLGKKIQKFWLLHVFYLAPIFLYIVLVTHQKLVAKADGFWTIVGEFVASLIPALNHVLTWSVYKNWSKHVAEISQFPLCVYTAGVTWLLFGIAVHTAYRKRVLASVLFFLLSSATFSGLVYYDMNVLGPAIRTVENVSVKAVKLATSQSISQKRGSALTVLTSNDSCLMLNAKHVNGKVDHSDEAIFDAIIAGCKRNKHYLYPISDQFDINAQRQIQQAPVALVDPLTMRAQENERRAKEREEKERVRQEEARTRADNNRTFESAKREFLRLERNVLKCETQSCAASQVDDLVVAADAYSESVKHVELWHDDGTEARASEHVRKYKAEYIVLSTLREQYRATRDNNIQRELRANINDLQQKLRR